MMIPGIIPELKKDKTLITTSIKRIRPSAKVTIPLQNAVPIVRPGDRVLLGQKIARAADASGVDIHASVCGFVTLIQEYPHPILGQNTAIQIQTDKQEELQKGIGSERPSWASLSSEEILSIFQQSGLLRMDRSFEPLHQDVLEKKSKNVRVLVINACESEPYLTSAYTLMMAHPLEILKGAEILRKLLAIERVIFVTEDNKIEAAELLKSKLYLAKWTHFDVRIFPTRYPQQAEPVIMSQLLKTKLALLTENETCRFAIYDAPTAFAVYEAVVMQKPLYERVVTVGGECVIEPSNVWARLGTSFQDAIKGCRGLLREPGQLLMNGPMQGVSVKHFDYPILPFTQAVLALPQELSKTEEVEACIRCGYCVDVCPSEISPAMITLAAEKEYVHVAKDYGAELCIGCGNCEYICPSKRPMLDLIRQALLSVKQQAVLTKEGFDFSIPPFKPKKVTVHQSTLSSLTEGEGIL